MINRSIFLVSLLLSANVLALPCQPMPGNEYEKIYCELQRKGKGHTLPNIYEFRKNPPLTQAFLLKKPAERAGIKITIPTRKNRETLQRQRELLLDPGGDRGNGGQTAIFLNENKASNLTPAPENSSLTPISVEPSVQVIEESVYLDISVSSDLLASCRRTLLSLSCADGDYELLGNLPNNQLAIDALAEGNRLNLPAQTIQSPEQFQHYLKEAYARYINGMLAIGLGASTMTYTKFAQLYQIMGQQGQDFVARFELMYSFLKKDKATIAVDVKRELPGDFALQYCHFLDEKLLACEYQRSNYLFARSEY